MVLYVYVFPKSVIKSSSQKINPKTDSSLHSYCGPILTDSKTGFPNGLYMAIFSLSSSIRIL